MPLKVNSPHLVAVDTNVALDFASGREIVIEAVATIRQRIGQRACCFPPTIVAELAHAADFGERPEKRRAARRVLEQHRAWGFRLINFVSVGRGVVFQIAERLRQQRLLPAEEVHDSLLVAEAALLGCSMLLTSDEHLCGIDFERLSFELKAFDVTAPVMATPREVVRKFFR